MRISLFSLCLFISTIGNAQVHRNVKRTPYSGNGTSSSTTKASVLQELENNMVYVQGGTFLMGSDSGKSLVYERPVHNVTLSSFYICKYEVTQELWQSVMGTNPSSSKGDKKPVEQVSWDDCQTFISKLNSLTGKSYRLPTEAEWEYAARGGVNSCSYKYSGGHIIDKVSWSNNKYLKYTVEVGKCVPNELGLYDMTGNVWEWCNDWYGNYSSDAQTNPTGPNYGSKRVCRGGGWATSEDRCRVTYRSYSLEPQTHDIEVGLRLVRNE